MSRRSSFSSASRALQTWDLTAPSGLDDIEAYADASYAPEEDNFKSVHGTPVMRAGCLIMWSSSRQPFVMASTAEAELLGYMEVHQQAEGVASLVERLLGSKIKRCIHGDNRSALSLCMGDVGVAHKA